MNRSIALRPRPEPIPDLKGGRILVFAPDEELADGAAEEVTGGYLDVNNCPPWDTWVALTEFSNGNKGRAAHLFAWVPPSFIDSVDRGIGVNPEQCIQWLDNWEDVAPNQIIAALRGLTSA